MRKTLSLCLCALLCANLFSAVFAVEMEETAPEEVALQETVPEEAAPEETALEEIMSEEAAPEEIMPEETALFSAALAASEETAPEEAEEKTVKMIEAPSNMSAFSGGRETTFDYPLLGDPMEISDEEFFGVWNEVGKRWAIEPYFNYARYPAMAAVEQAAKNGDYAEAAYELLGYYRPKKYERVSPISSTTQNMILASDLLGKNFYFVQFNGTMLNQFSVTNQWKDISIDVTSSIKSAAGAENYRTFMLNSIDRSAYYAEFMTREGGGAPVLSLTVNGKVVQIPAARDTYISAGANSGRNFGGAQTMIAQESGQFKAHDANTKRPYIAFDVSSLKATDNISAAKLNIRGRHVGSEGEKELVVYQWNDSTWEENTLCWDSFSEHYTFSCHEDDSWDYITSADTTDKGKICFLHRGDMLVIPAKAYDATKKEKYAYTFLRQQMALVNSVGGQNTAVMNALDMSTHLKAASESAWWVIDSQYMSPDVFKGLVKHFCLMARWEAETYYGTATNNWGSFATLGVYSILAKFKELAVYDNWMARTKTENERLNAGFVLADGTCVEAANGYVSTLLDTLYNPIAISVLTNTEFPYSAADMAQIRKLVPWFCYTMAPGFKSFNWGDDSKYTTQNIITQAKKWWENTELSDIGNLEYFATGGASGSPPNFTSVSYPDGLRTVMRNNWSDKALALNISAKGVASHRHQDQLSVSAYAYGKFLITDQGYGTVLTGDIRAQMIAPQSHSMLVMNGIKTTKSVDGVILGNELNRLYDYASYSSPLNPDGSDQTRTVLFDRAQKLWLVSDYVRPTSGGYNDYAQYWHMLPGANLSIDSETAVARSNFDDVNIEVTPVAPEEFSQIAVEDSLFSGASGSFIPSKKAAYHKRVQGNVVYDTVLVPENVGEDFSVATSKIETGLGQGAANAFYFRLTNNKTGGYTNSYYYHLNDLTKKGDVEIGRFKTDASVMYVTENSAGKVQSVFLMGASYLEDSTIKHDILFKSNRAVPVLTFRMNGQTYDIISSDLGSAALEDMTFYTYGTMKTAAFNCVSKSSIVKIRGRYLYFGAEPIVEYDDETAIAGGENGGPSPSCSTHSSASRGQTMASVEMIPPGGNAGSVLAAVEAELEGHWGKEEILGLYERKIIVGDPTLRLKDKISRAELIALTVKQLGLEPAEYGGEFEDVKSGDWFAGYVAAAFAHSLAVGDGDRFRPNDPITREELCKILMTAFPDGGQSGQDYGGALFDDDGEISDWARPYVYGAFAAGLVNGVGDNRFAPKDHTLREQAFAVAGRLLKK